MISCEYYRVGTCVIVFTMNWDIWPAEQKPAAFGKIIKLYWNTPYKILHTICFAVH